MHLEHRNDAEAFAFLFADSFHQQWINQPVAKLHAADFQAFGENLNERRIVDNPLLDEQFAEHSSGGLLFNQRAVELLLGDDALLHEGIADANFFGALTHLA